MDPRIWGRLCSRVKPEVWRHIQTSKSSLPEKFVLCGILFDRSKPSDMVCGVNYSLHRRINELHFPKAHIIKDHSSLLLKGILKGCAEQNALGSLAARALPYSAIRKMYILSLEQEFLQNIERKLLRKRLRDCNKLGNVAEDANAKDVFLPCSACFRYLNFIGKCVQDSCPESKNAVDVFTLQNLDAASLHHLKFPMNE